MGSNEICSATACADSTHNVYKYNNVYKCNSVTIHSITINGLSVVTVWIKICCPDDKKKKKLKKATHPTVCGKHRSTPR